MHPRLKTLLYTAARAAADQGDEPLYRERLEQARNLISGVRAGDRTDATAAGGAIGGAGDGPEG